MKIFKMNPENPDKKLINKAIDIMADGGVVLYPTDTVYGLGANIFNNNAVKRIYDIKKRDYSKPLSVLVSNVESIPLLSETNNDNLQIIENWLPGPYTFILAKKSTVSPFVSANAKVGIRIPDYKIATDLAAIFPITTTSANISDMKTLSNPQDILNQIGDVVDLVIDGGTLECSGPSTVIDLTMHNPYLVRKGLIETKIKDLKENINVNDINGNIGIKEFRDLLESNGISVKRVNYLKETLEKMGINDIQLNFKNISLDDFKSILENLDIKENIENINVAELYGDLVNRK